MVPGRAATAIKGVYAAGDVTDEPHTVHQGRVYQLGAGSGAPAGVRNVTDPDEQPRQFPFAPSSFCMWGSRPDIPEFRT